jgi:hypothetical protein
LIVWAGCAGPQVDPLEVPLGDLPPEPRAWVEHVLAEVAAVVPLEGEDVRSRPEIYDFLLAEMPFTGGVVRELGRGTWDIFRDAEKPDRNVFYVIDPEGIRLRFELVHREGVRRVYVSRGMFEMGILPPLEGRTVVVMRAEPRGGVIRTDAVVYVRVETPFYAKLAGGVRGVLEEKVREKSGYFIRAAKWVAEEVASRPEWVYNQVRGSRHVDPSVLREFREKFLGRK